MVYMLELWSTIYLTPYDPNISMIYSVNILELWSTDLFDFLPSRYSYNLLCANFSNQRIFN